MRLVKVLIALLSYLNILALNEASAQGFDQYAWPIDDPNVYTGTSGASGNNISGTIGEYRGGGTRFHEGVDMPYSVGTFVYFQENLGIFGAEALVLRLTESAFGSTDSTIVTSNASDLSNDGYKYTHVNEIQVFEGDYIVDGPTEGITERTLDEFGDWLYPRQRRLSEIGQTSNVHLHFEDKFNEPLGWNIVQEGLNPYTDTRFPIIDSKEVFKNGTSTNFPNGSGTFFDPYQTNGEIELDILINLHDPVEPFSSTFKTLPRNIFIETFRDYDFYFMDDNTIEFTTFTNFDGGANSGVGFIYGPNSTSSNFEVWVTNNFSHAVGGSQDYIRNLEKGTVYRTDIILTDAGGNNLYDEVYFVTGPDISGDVTTSTHWTTDINVVDDVTIQPDFGSITVDVWPPATLTVAAGKNIFVKPGATLYIHAGVNCDLSAGDGEIICDGGTVIDESGQCEWGSQSCILAMNGGVYRNTSSNQFVVDNGAFLAADGGTFELPDAGTVFESGSYWDIGPGSTIKVQPGRSITFKAGAYIDAVGTAAEPITFTSADGDPQRSEWGTVYIYGNNNTVEHAIIEGSDWGLKFYGTPSATSGNVVRNCTLRKNDQAIRAENTELDVYDCTIEDNRHAFVLINNTSATGGIYLDGNTVKDNDRDGIYSINSVVDVFNSTLDNNGMGNVSTIHGIWASNTSSIALGSRTYSSNSGGYNTIKNNHGAGVYRSSNSYVLVGDYIKPGTEAAGYNSIYNNGTYTGTYSGRDIYNANVATTFAHKIYWGSASGPSTSQFYGPVDYSNWLASPPGPGGAMPIAEQPPGSEKTINSFNLATPRLTSTSSNSQTSNDDTAIKMQLIARFKATIAADPASQEAVEALQQLYDFVRTDWQNKLGQRSTIYGYLNGLYTSHGNLEIGKTALQLMVVHLQSRGKNNEAIALATTARTKLTGTAQQENLVNLVIMNLHMGQTQTAENLFNEFLSAYPNEKNFTELLQEMFDDLNNTSLVSVPVTTKTDIPQTTQSEMTHTKTGIPTEFVLDQNYPNPFNPTTTIRYQLPEAVQVTIKIYNILGQEIHTLYDGRQEAGVHSIQWNGKTDLGETVASGVYIIHLVAGDFVATRKLAFMK